MTYRSRSRLSRARLLPFLAQHVEECVRYCVLKLVCLIARRPQSQPRNPDGPQRVLFMCEDAIGDLAMTLPAIRAIAEARPGNTVDVVVADYSSGLLANLPYIRDVIVFPRHDRRRFSAARAVLRRPPYDAVVDGMVLRGHVRTRSIALMAGARAPVWVGETDRGNDHVYTHGVPAAPRGMPHARRMMQLAAPFVRRGVQPTLRTQLMLSPSERDGAEATWMATSGTGLRVLVNISASCAERRWSDDRFAVILDRLRFEPPWTTIIVAGLPRDANSVRRLAAAIGATVEIPSLRDLIGLVAASHIIVTPDTAVCHIASAFGRTLVSLNLRNNETWAAHDTPGVRVVGPSARTLKNLQVSPVLAAIDEVLYAKPAEYQPDESTTPRAAAPHRASARNGQGRGGHHRGPVRGHRGTADADERGRT